MAKHIVITVVGSLGDLHPLMALALGLQERGHRVTMAAARTYREKIEREGMGFVPTGPDIPQNDPTLYARLFDPVRGPEFLMRKLVFPYLRETYRDLYPLLEKADFLINSPLAISTIDAAAQLKLPWASIALQPQLFFSAYDPPVLPILPLTEHLYNWSPAFWRPLLTGVKSMTVPWLGEVRAFQKELGVPSTGNPIFEGHFSPFLNLAMFSELMAIPQPDWPTNTHVSGFAFYDRMTPGEESLPSAVRDFFSQGEPPVVFTLGSSVVNTAGSFYDVSVEAARRLNCRALLLAGENRPARPVTDRMLVWDYAAYSQVFPHAAAIVHQGGMGTTAQAMRAGKPMIVVPHGFDQPDNAARIKRLGLSRTIYPKQYTVNRVSSELERLLQVPSYREKALDAARVIQGENGVNMACDLIEATLKTLS